MANVTDGGRGWPAVEIVEEAPREGMQIESRSITTAQKIELINRLSRTGLTHIVVGSFVSPRWVPQMSDIEEVLAGISPVAGVRYRALAFNARGRQRRAAFEPPISLGPDEERYSTIVHLCDTFLRRNINMRQSQEISRWPEIVKSAADAGARAAGIAINAAWGSNWRGEFSQQERSRLLAEQYELWTRAGIPVTRVWIGDPMGWNLPHLVAAQVAEIHRRWPSITTFHLHLHDTRGCALASAYSALAELGSDCRLVIDASLGGIGGCPYCGNGRATGMIATEDLVHLLQRMGLVTGVDVAELIEIATWLATVVGRPLRGRVSDAGPCPDDSSSYPVLLPLIETLEEAQHFRVGPRAYAGSRSPWRAQDPLYELTDATGDQDGRTHER
jgi:hydroxymethylglutaryl-CoA lyase